MTYTIDAKTPRGQAGQMLRAIQAIAKQWGLSAKGADVRVYDFDDYGDDAPKAYHVVWEDGPYEWGMIGGHGGDIFAEELGYSPYASQFGPTFKFAEHVYFEHHWSFDFIFCP